mmetsp:Transcript_143457/g.373798  ORF Transcript_143457/g.373798 Transcript_143457/m.373798 type:complete len:238 (-) Transcript_143457:80-793(-)
MVAQNGIWEPMHFLSIAVRDFLAQCPSGVVPQHHVYLLPRIQGQVQPQFRRRSQHKRHLGHHAGHHPALPLAAFGDAPGPIRADLRRQVEAVALPHLEEAHAYIDCVDIHLERNVLGPTECLLGAPVRKPRVPRALQRLCSEQLLGKLAKQSRCGILDSGDAALDLSQEVALGRLAKEAGCWQVLPLVQEELDQGSLVNHLLVGGLEPAEPAQHVLQRPDGEVPRARDCLQLLGPVP